MVDNCDIPAGERLCEAFQRLLATSSSPTAQQQAAVADFEATASLVHELPSDLLLQLQESLSDPVQQIARLAACALHAIVQTRVLMEQVRRGMW